MKMYIDTTDSNVIIIMINGEKFVTDAKRDKSQKLLPFIDEVLKKKKLKMSDISEVGVNTGPGSFTGIRVGLSVAQAIGFALSITVNGKKIHKGEIVDINYDN